MAVDNNGLFVSVGKYVYSCIYSDFYFDDMAIELEKKVKLPKFVSKCKINSYS